MAPLAPGKYIVEVEIAAEHIQTFDGADLPQLGRTRPLGIERLEVDGSHDAAARTRVTIRIKLRRDLCGNQPVRRALRRRREMLIYTQAATSERPIVVGSGTTDPGGRVTVKAGGATDRTGGSVSLVTGFGRATKALIRAIRAQQLAARQAAVSASTTAQPTTSQRLRRHAYRP